MNTSTGAIMPWEEVEKLPAAEQSGFIPINRDLSKLEEANRQIALYSPCGCGSGKKFKFCCKK